MMKVYCHPRCSTCKKALKLLGEHDVAYDYFDLTEVSPSKTEMRDFHLRSLLPIKKLFNTSGMAYRELQLKDKIPHMSDEEIYELLSSNGLLIKRPLVVADDFVSFGYKEEEYIEKYCK